MHTSWVRRATDQRLYRGTWLLLLCWNGCDFSKQGPRNADGSAAGPDAGSMDSGGPNVDPMEGGQREGGPSEAGPAEGGQAEAAMPCTAKCGDSILCAPEQCDDGNNSYDDTCLPSCLLNLTLDSAEQCGTYPAAADIPSVPNRAAQEPQALAFGPPTSLRVLVADYANEVSGSGYNLANLARLRNINAQPGADLWLQVLGVVGGSLTLVSTWDGVGGLSRPIILRELPGGSYGGQDEVAPFDFNGDGRADSIMSEAWGTPKPVIRSQWISLSKPGTDGYDHVEWRAPFLVDASNGAEMNGDGKTDLFTQYSGPCGWSIIVQLSSGDGTFSPPVKYRIDATPSSAGSTVSAVNVSGDAAADLLRAELLPEGAAVDVATNRGAAGFSASTRTLFAKRSKLPQIVDVDGDGKVDIAFVSAEADLVRVEVAFSQGDGSFAALVSWVSLSAGSIESAAATYLQDRNDDGRADLLAADERIAAGRGDGSFVEWQAIPELRGLVADINGDGKSDVLRPTEIPAFAGWDLQLRLRQ